MALKRDLVFVLKHKKFSESDKIVTFFGRRIGKSSAIAKGAQRPEVRKTSNLETGSLVKLAFAEGKNLDIITEADTILASPASKKANKYILYIAELADKYTVEKDPNSKIFRFLHRTLNSLKKNKNRLSLINEFHINLMREMGYLPDFSKCSQTGRSLKKEDSVYLSEFGPIMIDYDRISPQWPRINIKYCMVISSYNKMGPKLRSSTEKGVFKILNYLTESNLERKLVSKRLFKPSF